MRQYTDTQRLDFLIEAVRAKVDDRTDGQQQLCGLLSIMDDPTRENVKTVIDLCLWMDKK